MILKPKHTPPDSAPIPQPPQEQSQEHIRHATEADFIPYTCHYDPHTLITRNGELLQTVRIAHNCSGLNYEDSASGAPPLRSVIRQAIGEAVKTDTLAIWLHTFRRRRKIDGNTSFAQEAAQNIHEEWNQKHQWRFQYHNEVYVTLVADGQETSLFNSKELSRSFWPAANRKYREQHLETTHQRLTSAVDHLMTCISAHFDVKRLGICERPLSVTSRAAGMFSEPMEFLGKILNLSLAPMPLPENDLAHALNTHELRFGYNTMESRDAQGRRRYGALLTLKRYVELPVHTLDRFLQIPCEMIITETFNFIPAKIALQSYKEQRELLSISGDEQTAVASGLNDMLDSNKHSAVDYGEHQMSIMALSSEHKTIDSEVQKLQAAFTRIGLIAVREDIKLEEGFWAQLPANFEFIRRKSPINTKNIAGFSRLNLFPSGSWHGNHWGQAVSILPTAMQSPYFFNFHCGDNGHTLMFDYNAFEDTIGTAMLNFLLSESRKFNGNLYVFDRNRASQLLIGRLGGACYDTANASRDIKLNPFTLDNTHRNQAFLLAWLSGLLEYHATPQLLQSWREGLARSIQALYALPEHQRTLTALLTFLDRENNGSRQALAAWTQDSAFARIFGSGEDSIDLSHGLCCFEMSEIADAPHILTPVFSYLLHRIISQLDGKPTIIVMHEAWALLNNFFFAPRLESLLEMLRQNNAMLIATTRNAEECAGASITEILLRMAATRLYIADDVPTDYCPEATGLTDHDIALLERLERQKGQFLVKHGLETVVAEIPLHGMIASRAILEGDSKSLTIAAKSNAAGNSKESR